MHTHTYIYIFFFRFLRKRSVTEAYKQKMSLLWQVRDSLSAILKIRGDSSV